MVAEADREPVAVGGFARLAHRHHDAAPVRILARDSGLHQRRIGDRERDALRAVVADRAAYLCRHELCGAFACAPPFLRELARARERAVAGKGVAVRVYQVWRRYI